MADDDLESLLNVIGQVKRHRFAPSPVSAKKVLTDNLGAIEAFGPYWASPYVVMPPMRPPTSDDIDALLARAEASLNKSPFTVDQVFTAIEDALLTSAPPSQGVDMLKQLAWPQRWEVIDRLKRKDFGLGGGTYLARLDSALQTLPGRDPAIEAAVWVVMTSSGGSLSLGPTNASRFATLMDSLDSDALAEILVTVFGVSPFVVEFFDEILAANPEWLAAEPSGSSPARPFAALAAAPPAAAPEPDPSWLVDLRNKLIKIPGDLDFEEWKNKNSISYFYRGTEIHNKIAYLYAAYHEIHRGEGFINYNADSILKIFSNFRSFFGMYRLSPYMKYPWFAWMATCMPDIYEYTYRHRGWVYEIKSHKQLKEATQEADNYAVAIRFIGVPQLPALPGPSGGEGTGPAGPIPMPGGYFAYCSPEPGAIIYVYVEVKEEDYKKKYPGTADEYEDRGKNDERIWKEWKDKKDKKKSSTKEIEATVRSWKRTDQPDPTKNLRWILFISEVLEAIAEDAAAIEIADELVLLPVVLLPVGL